MATVRMFISEAARITRMAISERLAMRMEWIGRMVRASLKKEADTMDYAPVLGVSGV